MKLNITLPELEAGERISRISDKQMEKINDAMFNRIPVATKSLIPLNGGVSLVFLTGSEKMVDKRTRLTFRPVHNKAFQVINARTKELVSLTVQFTNKQITFDRDGQRETNFSLNGPGVDPDTEPDPKTLLAKLMENDHSNPIVRRCAKYISLMR